MHVEYNHIKAVIAVLIQQCGQEVDAYTDELVLLGSTTWQPLISSARPPPKSSHALQSSSTSSQVSFYIQCFHLGAVSKKS